MRRARPGDDDGWAGGTAGGPHSRGSKGVKRRSRPCHRARFCRGHRMIPFLDLRAQYKTIKDDVQQAIDKVFETGQYILGDEVAAFESEFAKHVKAEPPVGLTPRADRA